MPPHAESGPRAQARGWSLPLLILLFAAALRVYGLGSYPFEQDELYTVIESTHLFDSPLQPGIEARPLYYLLQHAALWVLPASHVGLRLLPLLFGLAGVWLTWVLGRQALGRTAGLVAMFLVAISPWHLHASSMARYWSLVYLLAAAFFLFLYRGYVRERPRDYLLALGALVLGTLSHPTFLLPAAGAALGLSLKDAQGRWGWRWPSRTAWRYLWIPFLLFLAADYLALSLAGRESAVRNFNGRGLEAALRLVPAMVEWMTPIMFVTGALGALLLAGWADTSERRRWGGLALVGALAGFVLLFAAAFVTNSYADYGMAILPLVFVSAGGLAQLAADRIPSGAGAVGPVAAAVLAAGVLPSTVSHLSDGMRFDYRPAFQRIAEASPDTPVLAWPIVLQRYYAPELDAQELRMDPRYLDAALAEEGELWAVVSVRRYGITGDGSGQGAAWLSRHCRLDSSHQRPRLDYRMYRVELYHCTLPASGSAAAPRG